MPMRQAQRTGRPHIRGGDERDRAGEEALHWLIALQERPDEPGLKGACEAWRSASPDNAAAWREAEHVWAVLGEAGPSVRTERANAGRAATPRRRWGQPAAVAAVALALAACLVLAVLPSIGLWLAADYSTATAELRRIELEDGSVVQLGAGSAIDLAWTEERRRIRLLAGEAYFEVAPDPSRPFTVEAAGVEAEALGTAFDVRLVAGAVSVAVEHGRVAVARGGDLLAPSLTAGDWARVGLDGSVEKGRIAPELVAAWRQGMLVARDESVADILSELRRHYRGTIVVAASGLEERRVTGVYRLGEPIVALEALAGAHGARIHRVSPWIAIVTRR